MAGSGLERRLGDWGAYVARHRRRVLIGAFVLTLIALPFAARAVLNLDVNLFNQASDSLKRFRLVRELSEDFGGDMLVAVAQTPENPSAAQTKELKAFALLLTAELAKVGTTEEDRAGLSAELLRDLPEGESWLRHVECQSGQNIEKALKKILKDRPYVGLTPGDIETLKKKFEPEALKKRLDEVAEILPELDAAPAQKKQMYADPLDLQSLAKVAMKERTAGKSGSFKGEDGFFLSKDGTTLVVVGRAVLSSTRLDFNRALMVAAQRAENRAIALFETAGAGGRGPGTGERTLTVARKGEVYGELAEGATEGSLRVGFTGMPAVSVENERALKYDLLGNTTTSFVGILLLFLIVFRRIGLAWDVVWTTTLVIVWTLAVAGITRGSISVMGGAFTCILLGTGTDYAIHLQNVFHHCVSNERREVADALRETLTRCGKSILIASATTALAFLGVGFTRFNGLAEFGFLAGVSVLLSCAMMIVVFPALLCRPSKKAEGKAPEALGLGLPTWGRMLERRGVRTASLVAGIVFLFGAIAFIKFGPDAGADSVAGVAFDADMGNLRSLRVHAIQLRETLGKKFGQGLVDVRVVVEAADEERAFAGAEVVAERLRPFIEKGELIPGGTVLDFVPSARQQRENIAALKTFDVEAAEKAFIAAAQERFGKAWVRFKPFIDWLRDFALLTRQPEPLTLASVKDGALSNMLAPFVKLDSKDGAARVRLASSWFPSKVKMPAEWYDRVAEALEKDPPEGIAIRATSPPMVGYEMKASLLRDCAWISLLVGICVAIALAAAFGSVTVSLLAVIPLVFAYLALLAGVTLSQAMGWDFKLNFVNLIMFPLLLGSGIDVGIYMVHEALSERRPGIAELMSDTGRSVLCCTLTTLVGFGSFFWSSYTGLISLGIAAMFGYTGALFGALVVLPALLGILRERMVVKVAEVEAEAVEVK